MKTALVTGAEGFIGRNLCQRLRERQVEVLGIGRGDAARLSDAAARADVIFHLAGVNRPKDPDEFHAGNVGFTELLCEALKAAGSQAPLIYASSAKATEDSDYGRSKRAAEEILLGYGEAGGVPVHVFRLPNVFGKWVKPNYNSAVATFCHNIARGEGIEIHDPAARLDLVYIDDVVDAFLRIADGHSAAPGFAQVEPVYSTSVGEVAEIISSFPISRETMITPRVGTGLVRALYSTYLSYLPQADFDYRVPVHGDPRGVFVEMLKTPDCGQFSYFTAGPGVTRGDHYHHTKAEKFLVISGTAHFGFRHIVSDECHEIVVRGGEGRVVETIPGWTHNITNIGSEELVVMLWANEIFDRARPDTIAMKV
ncbi:UDP-2-acetamido-2,6-beta-L-arabino-hexul-4-ose reductase [Sphingosinicella sp. LY1275]|uniref:UDP-2-acetamido-2,6-beta-L-arabino-hexul-4-ose reductase n=1 Tax=Sphingosinicella sp. LY1275 TaxID=3095379 RepID=UPI002ADEB9A1|nr:NAD-dependent epimerase/dehydratase family protein [Sphingosinicella sp. LY1275]MEA1014487.1 NAD-dependent epimerase/dehydratase family protein [Sphingosinicella sp. LY1275]